MSADDVLDDYFFTSLTESQEPIVLRDISGGNKVVKFPEHNVVIKYGRGVIEAEAEAQKQAFAILDSSLVYVPKVYRFHHDTLQNIGYLVMELIDGSSINVCSTAHIGALEKALDHLRSVKREFPGPLSGQPRGILWEDSAPSCYYTAEGLEGWINQWQPRRVNLKEEEFVLCHLDTALENMLYMPSGQICLLDWASAGYYPRYFELAAHLKKGRPDEAVERLLRTPRRNFSVQEEKDMSLLIQACANSMAYVHPRSQISNPPLRRQYLAKQPSMPQMHA